MVDWELPLSYCGNVHPVRTLEDVERVLREQARPIADEAGFPIAFGLWLPNSAVDVAAADASLVDRLSHQLAEFGLVCYTMNAFPFGDFHSQRVKEQVYLPDWCDARRELYTCRCGDILARLLPDDAVGSISTSPLAFKRLQPQGVPWRRFFPALIRVTRHFADLEQATGKTIRLGLEPEPGCVLETIDETLAFFHEIRQNVAGTPDEDAVGRHLGVCFDVCHQAVEFEDAAASLKKLAEHEINVVKIHLSCALELGDPRNESLRQELSRYVEPKFLHQTLSRTLNKTLFLEDLSHEHCRNPSQDWLDAAPWRIHFHVPINEHRLGSLATTRPALESAVSALAGFPQSPHLEVETYTWSILTQGEPTIVEGIARELRSARELLQHVAEQ